MLAGALVFSVVGPARSEEDQQSTKENQKAVKDVVELAKDVQNPVSDLLRIGLLNTNWFGGGPNNYDFNVFDLQAIWAKRLGKWAVINRLNIPLIYLPSSAPPAPSGDSGSTFGLGDIQYTAFIARDESERIFKGIGGIGPTILFNSSTDDRLGTGKWGIGPSAALLSKPGPWLTGLLVTNIWSFAGESDREDLNFLFLRPFVNYNLWKGWYLTTTPLITANWNATERNKWSVPIGGGVGKVVLRAGKQPLNFRVQSFYFVEKADFAPDWTLNFEFQILFPRYDVEPRAKDNSTD